MKATNLLGRKVGRLSVVARDANDIKGRARWICKCACGVLKAVYGASLVRGDTKSCGCLNRDNHLIHGGTNTPEFQAWVSMRSRCSNAKARAYKNYGARGIKVCVRWKKSFSDFLADMGKRPAGTSLERRDNNGGYTPTNCLWATKAQQDNNKRTNRLIVIDGVTHTLSEWCKITGIGYHLAHGRIRNGWSEESAIYLPLGISGQPHSEI